MIIREGSNFVEIVATGACSQQPGSPSPYDIEFALNIASGGFSGQGATWIEVDQFTAFLAQLRELEGSRTGSAIVEGMSPEQFQLRLWAVDGLGHMAVAGRLTHHQFGGWRGPHLHAIEFGFEFDPTLLPSIVSEFQSMIAPRSLGTDSQ
jgi:hypothetical protein